MDDQTANRPARSRLLLAIPALLMATLLSATVWSAVRWAAPARFHGTAYEPADPAPGFQLTEHTGRPVRLEDFRGRVVLLFFGYTSCPDVCPLTLAKLRRALDEIDATPDDVRVLLVTVDPERDTPEVLARYVSRFGAGVSGVTGSPETIAEVAAAYGVHAGPDTREGSHGMVTHTGAIFGIDREGRLRVLQRPENPEAEIAADVRALLRD